jgi:predicted phosphoadenosine phosphosulfate sulfurtransferase
MKLLLLPALIVFCALSASAQTWQAWDKPKDKMDWVWNASKFAGITAATADTITTVQMIDRGNVETNKIHNLMVDRRNPAPVRRTAILIGQAYLANLGLDYAYRRVQSRKWKWLVIAARTALTIDSAKCAIHNSQLD